MEKFHTGSICAAALLVLVTAQPAGAATVRMPRPTIPGVGHWIVDCDVTADQMTANCGDTSSRNWKPAPRGQVVAKDLDARPEHLAGATPGARVEVMVRRDLGKRTGGASAAEPADLGPAAAGGPATSDCRSRLAHPPDRR